jgi:hypothetical protein
MKWCAGPNEQTASAYVLNEIGVGPSLAGIINDRESPTLSVGRAAHLQKAS